MSFDQIYTAIKKLVADGKAPGIMFVRTCEEGEEASRALSAILGQEVPFVSAKEPFMKEHVIKSMLNGTCQVCTATSTMGTGVDIPGLRFVALPEMSKAPIGIVQFVGRAARLAQDKYEFFVLNPARNSAIRRLHLARHGFPEDSFVLDSMLGRTNTQTKPRSYQNPISISSERSYTGSVQTQSGEIGIVEGILRTVLRPGPILLGAIIVILAHCNLFN